MADLGRSLEGLHIFQEILLESYNVLRLRFPLALIIEVCGTLGNHNPVFDKKLSLKIKTGFK